MLSIYCIFLKYILVYFPGFIRIYSAASVGSLSSTRIGYTAEFLEEEFRFLPAISVFAGFLFYVLAMISVSFNPRFFFSRGKCRERKATQVSLVIVCAM